jgi:hypothetical protein
MSDEVLPALTQVFPAGGLRCSTTAVAVLLASVDGFDIVVLGPADFGVHVGGRGHWLERFNDNVGRIQVHA